MSLAAVTLVNQLVLGALLRPFPEVMQKYQENCMETSAANKEFIRTIPETIARSPLVDH